MSRYFKTATILTLVLLACGPKPGKKSPVVSTPEAVWNKFISRYADISSLAISGELTVEAENIYSCGLQIFFVSPDSFAFLAEGTLGIDLVRGAMIGDSGFWEIPREDYYESIKKGDLIQFDESAQGIDIDRLIRAIFFFNLRDNFNFMKSRGARYEYSSDSWGTGISIVINRDSATPINLAFQDQDGIESVQYYGWKSICGDMLFPSRMEMHNKTTDLRFEYLIKKIKVNPEIKLFYFLPIS